MRGILARLVVQFGRHWQSDGNLDWQHSNFLALHASMPDDWKFKRIKCEFKHILISSMVKKATHFLLSNKSSTMARLFDPPTATVPVQEKKIVRRHTWDRMQHTATHTSSTHSLARSFNEWPYRNTPHTLFFLIFATGKTYRGRRIKTIPGKSSASLDTTCNYGYLSVA